MNWKIKCGVLLVLAVALLVGVYYLTYSTPSLGALLAGIGVFLCVNDTPADTYGSDPAGAGMARGLTFAISVLYGIITMIVFYLVVKLISVGLVLPLCVVLGIFSFSKLISNQKKKEDINAAFRERNRMFEDRFEFQRRIRQNGSEQDE